MGAPILAEMAQPLIPTLEKLIGTARDGALLRYSLGNEYLKAKDTAHAIEQIRNRQRKVILHQSLEHRQALGSSTTLSASRLSNSS